MGSYGSGGTGSNESAQTIDQGRVKVPNRIWKVLVILPEGTNDLNRINSTARVIAVNTPNNSLSSEWGNYRTTVDAIETATGYDFLSNITKDIQDSLVRQTDKGLTK
jgi:endonuclease G, mitochondrial